MKTKLFLLIVLTSSALVPTLVFAQGGEIRPYAGYVWPSGDDPLVDKFEHNQLLGVRGGYYITPNFELGGNYSWNNHFQPKNSGGQSTFAGDLGFPQGKVRANTWEMEFSYNFGSRSIVGRSMKPYIVAGAGGITTNIKGADEFTLSVRSVTAPTGELLFFPNQVLSNSETFFTVSYGGGLKAERLWGPMGFFGDFRGRTMPNFFGNSRTWPELSAGLSFAWGER